MLLPSLRVNKNHLMLVPMSYCWKTYSEDVWQTVFLWQLVAELQTSWLVRQIHLTGVVEIAWENKGDGVDLEHEVGRSEVGVPAVASLQVPLDSLLGCSWPHTPRPASSRQVLPRVPRSSMDVCRAVGTSARVHARLLLSGLRRDAGSLYLTC